MKKRMFDKDIVMYVLILANIFFILPWPIIVLKEVNKNLFPYIIVPALIFLVSLNCGYKKGMKNELSLFTYLFSVVSMIVFQTIYLWDKKAYIITILSFVYLGISVVSMSFGKILNEKIEKVK